jgi:GT2 family glycosyltransferase
VEDQGTSHIAVLPKITFLCCNNNNGYAIGNNKGLEFIYRQKDIDAVLILNNDILFVEDIIPKLKSFLFDKQDAGIVSPILYKENMMEIDYNCARRNPSIIELILIFGFQYIFGRFVKSQKKKYCLLNDPLINTDAIPIELSSGSCMMLKKSLFYQIKGFDPNTFLYYEENILYKKISQLGLRNYLLPTLKCIHLGAGSTSCSANYFIGKCVIDSALYYVKTYCRPHFYQYFLLKVATTLFKCKLIITKTLKLR